MVLKLMDNTSELANVAADLLVEKITNQPKLLLCAATGNTPTLTYQKMVKKLKTNKTNKLKIIKLDEWGGVSMEHPQTCEQYLQKHLIKPLQIPKKRYIGFNSHPKKPKKEVKSIQQKIDRNGPIDICVLGLGSNGHIAFNEPAKSLTPHCHIAHLSQKSMQHSMAIQMEQKPTYGLTLGMAEIIQSKMIIMLITGSHKKEVAKSFLSKNITTQLPASFLWLHPNVYCFIDKAAYE